MTDVGVVKFLILRDLFIVFIVLISLFIIAMII